MQFTSGKSWSATVKFVGTVPTDLEYKYAIRKGQYIKRWESTPSPRLVALPINDAFGYRPDIATDVAPEKVKWVEEGWLVGNMQISLCLSETSVNLTEQNINPEKLIVTCGTAAPRVLDLPLTDMTNITFTLPLSNTMLNDKSYSFLEPDSPDLVAKLTNETGGRIEFNFLSKTMSGSRKSQHLVACAYMSPSEIVGQAKELELTLMNGLLQPIGVMKLRCVLALPYSCDSNQLKSLLPNAYWKQTRLIGHRGAGAEGNARKDNRHYVHIRENTVLSMYTASSTY